MLACTKSNPADGTRDGGMYEKMKRRYKKKKRKKLGKAVHIMCRTIRNEEMLLTTSALLKDEGVVFKVAHRGGGKK